METPAITGSSAEENPDTTTVKSFKKASLCDLPNELLGVIEKHVSTVDACCLSVCNKRLKEAFRHRYDECISKPSMTDERGRFISLIAAKYPTHFYCDDCLLLHTTEMAPRLGLKDLTTYQRRSVARPLCIQISDHRVRHEDSTHHYVHRPEGFKPCLRTGYNIDRAHLQLAMKRHQFGEEYGIPLDTFTYTKVEKTTELCDDLGPTVTSLKSYDARIVSGELVLRTQQVARVKVADSMFGETLRVLGHGSCSSVRTRIMGEVAHILSPSSRPHINPRFHKHPLGASRDRCPIDECSVIWQCRDCFVEYQIEAEIFNWGKRQYSD
ncbi:hypothetical protein DL98DRAFT_585028 [Cadophora sp. DSE1049]|nr:hypothetical protein DL98DRAFT_585028 [Cadophora sp. DSE1049]